MPHSIELEQRTSGCVMHHLAPPIACDACKSERIQFTDNAAVYGVSRGPWPKIWLCLDCRARVSCHSMSKSPVGHMCGDATRKLRRTAHMVFDPIWERAHLGRDRAYLWMADVLDIPEIEAHISQLTDEQLHRLIRHAIRFMANPERGRADMRELHERRTRSSKRAIGATKARKSRSAPRRRGG